MFHQGLPTELLKRSWKLLNGFVYAVISDGKAANKNLCLTRNNHQEQSPRPMNAKRQNSLLLLTLPLTGRAGSS